MRWGIEWPKSVPIQQPLAFQETSGAARAVLCVRWVSSALVGVPRNTRLGSVANEFGSCASLTGCSHTSSGPVDPLTHHPVEAYDSIEYEHQRQSKTD